MANRLTIKGQVTIPKAVRELLGIKPGNEVAFRKDKGGRVTVERADRKVPKSRFGKMRGHAGRGMSTQAIMALTRGEV